ncbi:MAG: FAD binding domain-containing protein [Pseudorhodoplanes sp.]|nr:FAD binding domain-containing protein [Pseudorhodoplanes sp.]GIK82016.1 MAG: hypothetical protein BroJett024_31210 [Alphaproteobacteria bacterium]
MPDHVTLQRSENYDARRAVVVGGSMSGLLAGLMLRQAGWAVDVFERVEGELSGRGAGIVAQPELIAVLAGLGLATGHLGVAVERRRLFDSAGRLLIERPCPQILTAWERVYRLLRDAFPAAHYHRWRALAAFEQDAGHVRVRFSDGSAVEADLLVGADGIRSTVRAQLLPEAKPLYAGYVAWRALVAEASLSPAVHRDLFESMSFCLPPGEQMLGYPVAGPGDDLRPGRRRYNLVWYRPADEQTGLVDLLTDDSGMLHPVSIPPPLIRRDVIAAMHAAARRLLAPQFSAIMQAVEEPILQPIYDLAVPRMAFGRVAILGDAAFVARPHVAAGVSKAADDAAALVAALAQERDVAAALRRFEAERLPVGHRIISRARQLGAYLQAGAAKDDAEGARHGVPEAVIAETALTDFLKA